MHAIQQDILHRITLAPEARYSDLKSDEIDGNLFMYHLNQLMQTGYIEKTDDKTYELTAKGKQHVSMLSTTTGEQRLQPQILVMIVAKNIAGEYALFRWKREPNMNLISFPHGKMHAGASVLDMAVHELQEKTGLTGECQYRGDIYLRVMNGDELVTHQLVHLFEVQAEGEVQSSTQNGEAFWGNPEDVPEIELVPGTWEILDMLRSKGGRLFEEISISL